MNGMTTQDRLNDICQISGLSEEIVRRVFDAERESIAKSLKRGERATLIGRCVIRPEIRSRLEIDGSTKRFVKLKAQVTSSLEAKLKDVTGFEIEEDDDNSESLPEGIWTTQIQDLV